MNDSHPRITFGIIVLNGEPYTRYNLRALYPFAHQIIVVEGAAPAAATIATSDGHSTDETLEVVRAFQQFEDPQKKVILITAEDEGYPNGFWPGEKHEQSQAFAKRTTGDYLWQVDVDEFYLPKDIVTILDMLKADPTITQISFKQFQFWGGFDYYVDSWYLYTENEIHRLFRWKPGYTYSSHRPPTVLTDEGVNLRTLHWIDSSEMAKRGIYFYHYSLILPKQVLEKCEYYGKADWAKRAQAQEWAQEVYLKLKRPYQVFIVYDYPGWLERFTGEHPPEIMALQDDIKQGKINIDIRPTADIEVLLNSRRYQVGRSILRFLEPIGIYLMPSLWRQRFKSFRKDPWRYVSGWSKRRADLSR